MLDSKRDQNFREKGGRGSGRKEGKKERKKRKKERKEVYSDHSR